jgi:alkyl hydroperoxide reductase subunit AhpF
MQPRLLNDEIRGQITDLFSTELKNPVQLLFFTSETVCDTCDSARQLLEELAELSDLLGVTIYDMDEQPQIAQNYKINLTPGLVVAGIDQGKFVDFGIRFLGLPSGYEFSSLIHAIGLVSRRDSGLKPEIRNELKALKSPINLKVFVTPT